MRKCLFLILMLPPFLFAQYYAERSTEQSFERSGIFFKSYFLNTFGLKNIKNVSVGLIDEPLLNLYLNPANLPKLGKENTLVYLDFRGDRTSSALVDQYVVPNYYANEIMYRRPIDPRWNYITRDEPEPIFSLGVISFPIPEITRDFFIGATYQIIHREEKFYNTPYWIYSSLYAYDAAGNKAEGLANVPVKDRYSSKDEMITDGHLYTAFTGYKITDKLNVGISINGITHKRNGGYLNVNNDEYGNTKSSIWENAQEQDRNQNYHHFDVSAGISYLFSEKLRGGLKAGSLSGTAEQNYYSHNYYKYIYNAPENSENWSNSFSNSSTNQSWNHKGIGRYIGVNFYYTSTEEKSITGYYRYTKGNEDLSSVSTIIDTSFYASQWIYDYDKSKHNYNGKSWAKDLRYGSGNRSNYNHEAALSLNWKLNSSSKIIIGAYWNKSTSEIKNSEPVNVIRYSEYHSRSTGANPYNYDYLNELKEGKMLKWEYTSDHWTIQIPVFFQFDLNENFGLLVGVNRILEGWEIHDRTTAYFDFRERNEDGTIKRETNFGERYTQPSKNLTENETKVVTKFYAAITPALKINLLIDPEFESQFRVAQWWLSFEACL